ncbi:MAG: hypothetical protein M1831_007181 [Alyxoria varia]|nr:MAG: hypothetical protein M1831_007181 [Alyxoria varia]
MPLKRSTPLCQVRHGGASEGMGLFATQDITVGNFIIEEPCFFYVEHSDKDPDELSANQSAKKWAQARKRVPGMPDPEAIFKTLAAPAHKAESRSVYSIFRSNAYSLEPPPNSGIHPASANFETMTRVNHSCMPNSILGYDWEKRRMGFLRTFRNINKDEEVTIA